MGDEAELRAEVERLRAEVERLQTHECWWWWACRGEGEHLRGNWWARRLKLITDENERLRRR